MIKFSKLDTSTRAFANFARLILRLIFGDLKFVEKSDAYANARRIVIVATSFTFFSWHSRNKNRMCYMLHGFWRIYYIGSQHDNKSPLY